MAAWWALATQGGARGLAAPRLAPPLRQGAGAVRGPGADVRAGGGGRCAAPTSAPPRRSCADDPLCGQTARTLEHLVERHPGRRFALVVGADILAETPRWYRWDRVTELARVVVVGREGYPGRWRAVAAGHLLHRDPGAAGARRAGGRAAAAPGPRARPGARALRRRALTGSGRFRLSRRPECGEMSPMEKPERTRRPHASPPPSGCTARRSASSPAAGWR